MVLFCLIAILNINTAYSQDEFVPGQLVVKLKDRTKLNSLVSEVSKDNSEIVDSIEELDLYVVEVPTDQLKNKRAQFSLSNNYQYVDKNYIVRANAIPNDSLFGQQTYFNLIDAQQAWDTVTGDPDVVIAVLDTGLEATHQHLAGKSLPGCSTLGGFSETSCGTNTNDIDGHGSGVSGTAAAQTNSSSGVAGICWGCQILPVKLLNDNGTGSDIDVTQGILFAKNYALANPTKKVIINMSLGRSCENPSPLDPAMQEAIN